MPRRSPSLFRTALVVLFLTSTAASGAAPFDAATRWTAIALQEENFDQAVDTLLTQVIKADGRFPSDRINLARSLIRTRSDARALSLLDEVDSMGAPLPHVPFFRAVILRRRLEHAKALAACDQALTLRPGWVEALFLKARTLDAMQRRAESRTVLQLMVTCLDRGGTFPPNLVGPARFLAHKHLSLSYLMDDQADPANRHQALAMEFSTGSPPGDEDLDSGPSLPALDPASEVVFKELHQAGLEVAPPPGPTPLSLEVRPWTTASTTPSSSAGRLDLTTSALKDRGLEFSEIHARVVTDLDHDGDLDLVVGARRGVVTGVWMLQNRTAPATMSTSSGMPSLPTVTASPSLVLVSAQDCGATTALASPLAGLTAGDLDQDNATDLVLFPLGSPPRLALSRRQCHFSTADVTEILTTARAVDLRVTGAGAMDDLDGDGRPDLVHPVASGLLIYRQSYDRAGVTTGTSAAQCLGLSFEVGAVGGAGPNLREVVTGDLDGDGRLDLVTVTHDGSLGLYLNRSRPGVTRFETGVLPGPRADQHPRAGVSSPRIMDLDGDGRLDLWVSPSTALINTSTSASNFLKVSLKSGGMKTPPEGLGSLIWIRAGGMLLRRQVDGPLTTIPMGSADRADLVRVQWTNGIIQNHLAPATTAPANRTAVLSGRHLEIEQKAGLGGPCPYLYVRDGKSWRFVTDALADSPLGLPAPFGGLLPPHPRELLVLPSTTRRTLVRDPVEIRVTEEYREVTYLDQVQLWAIDHAPGHTIVPAGGAGASEPPRLVALERLLAPIRATSGSGEVVTRTLAASDGAMTRPPMGPVQGLAADSLVLEFEGVPSGRPVWLLLEGLVYWTDSGINTALAQTRPHLLSPPALEVMDAAGTFQPVVFPLPFPAGRTKTALFQLPDRLVKPRLTLRLRSTMRFFWDRVALGVEAPAPLTISKVDPVACVVGPVPLSRLGPDPAEPPWILDPTRPLDPLEAQWIVPRGVYTAFGSAGDLLTHHDDRSVILGPGDGVDVTFARLSAPLAGRVRTCVVHLAGYCKDAHPATWASSTVEPLPFRDMTGYGPDVAVSGPRQDALRQGMKQWLTRRRGSRW